MAAPISDDLVHALRLQLEEAGAVGVPPETLLSLCNELVADVQQDVRREIQENTFNCPVCQEDLPFRTGWKLGTCDDLLCKPCAVRYLDGITSLPVSCPTCREPLHPELCLSVVEGTTTESKFSRLVAESHCEQLKYCANEKCVNAFDWVPDPELRGTPFEFRVLCPLCKKATCVQCSVLWHENLTCEEYKNKEDMNAVGQLARDHNWMNCPQCNMLVEKTEGCNHIQCRCGTHFCIQCGERLGPGGLTGCKCGAFRGNRNRAIHANNRLQQAIANANRLQCGAGNAHKPHRGRHLVGTREYGQPGPARLDFPDEMDDDPEQYGEQSRRHGRAHLRLEVLERIRGVTGEMLRNCTCPYNGCRRGFTSLAALEQHLNETNEHPVWICCNRPFASLNAYQQHRRDVHELRLRPFPRFFRISPEFHRDD